MKFQRAISESIIEKLGHTNKAIIIYGARQVGKTTLANELINKLKLKTLSINADEQKYIDVLSSRDFDKLKSLVYGYDLLFIDEAQRVPNIGINLKILLDGLPSMKIIVTGSFSFNLADKIAEPLTGRKWTYTLFPISLYELKKLYNNFELHNKLEELMIYGSYPEILTTINYNQKRDLIEEIGRSYLYKDVLELTNTKYQSKIKDLLKLLAFQVGSEVSIYELSNTLGISRDTIERYIDLLEKSFVIFTLSGFSRNLRKEISKMNKIYFYDLGIRNMVINNFNFLNARNDIGQLWENFLMIERKKFLSYNNISSSVYFWRTYTGAELDYIEDRDGKLWGYEFKYKKTNVRTPKTWMQTYENANFQLINRDNYIDFLI